MDRPWQLGEGTEQIAGVTITGGTSSLGGGLFNQSEAILTIKDSILSNNIATDVGGAIYNQLGATLSVDDSILTGNTNDFGGGGMVNPGGTVSLRDITVSGNRSLDSGAAGIGNNGVMTLTDSTVSDNSTPGGLFKGWRHLQQSGRGLDGIEQPGHREHRRRRRRWHLRQFRDVALQDSLVSGNSAGVAGGGIYNNSGTVTLQNSVVSGNTLGNCAPAASVTGCAG
jgi:fibronectin-binding autotransporter adhesin